jgi:hypothetical protein
MEHPLKVKLPVATVNTVVDVAAETVIVQGLIVEPTVKYPYAFPAISSGGQRSPMRQ